MYYQSITVVYLFIALLMAAHDHGKPRTGEHNFWVLLIFTLVVLIVLIGGGFFDVWIK